jgi:hypothetical protein
VVACLGRRVPEPAPIHSFAAPIDGVGRSRAVGAMAGSLVLRLLERDSDSIFVGQWAPTLLVLGLYNKIVKELGHEGERRYH